MMQRIILTLLFVLQSVLTVNAKVCEQDDVNREVCLLHSAKRVVSLAPSLTELVDLAGGTKKLVAVDSASHYPKSIDILPKIGRFPNYSLETIISYKPDLVLLWLGGRSPSLLGQRLQRMGIAVYYNDSTTFASIVSSTQKIGRLLGTQDVSKTNAQNFNSKVILLKKRFQKAKPLTVFFQIWSDPLITINSEQMISKAISLCGGVNLFSMKVARAPTVNIESVIQKNPDVIVSSGQTSLKKLKQYWNSYTQMNAVKKDLFFVIPSDLITHPSPRILEGTTKLCNFLQQARKNYR